MSDDEFEQYLKKFCEEINKLNESKTKAAKDFLILDKRYFNFDENNNKYSAREGVLDLFKNATFMFVGDNPGTEEKKNLHYFFNSGDGRKAGPKFSKALKNIEDLKNYIVFNKALVSTPSTSDLRKKDVEKTEKFVREFIEKTMGYNKTINVVFLGISSLNKRSPFHNLVEPFLKTDNVYILKHPVVNMLKCDDTVFESQKYDKTVKGFLEFLKDVKKYKNLNIENDSGNHGGEDGNDGGADGLSPVPVI